MIVGHSWGSALGIVYAARFPAKIVVYVGLGQVADTAASEVASYAFALAKAEERGHRKAVKQLRAIGPPPHSVKAIGTQRRWLMAMGGALGPRLSIARLVWRGLTSPEASVLDLVRLVRGSAFSLRLLWPELIASNVQRDYRRFEMPVFFLLGRFDMQVVASVAASYFNVIDAPQKELIWFENSGHMAPFEEPELFNRIMTQTVRPLAI